MFRLTLSFKESVVVLALDVLFLFSNFIVFVTCPSALLNTI